MEVRELEKALKYKLGLYVKFIGIYASDRIPLISYSTKPILLIACNTLKSSANINTIGHWVAFCFEFQPKKKAIFFIAMVSHHIFISIVDFLIFLENIEIYPYIILENNFSWIIQ